jgi:hypothetical protein
MQLILVKLSGILAISIFRVNSTTRESIFKCKIALFEYHRIVDCRDKQCSFYVLEATVTS